MSEGPCQASDTDGGPPPPPASGGGAAALRVIFIFDLGGLAACGRRAWAALLYVLLTASGVTRLGRFDAERGAHQSVIAGAALAPLAAAALAAAPLAPLAALAAATV